jgi:surface antigen Omp85-like protein
VITDIRESKGRRVTMKGAIENGRRGGSHDVRSERRSQLRLAVALTVVFAASAAPLFAQTEPAATRADALSDARDEKQIEPYRPNFLEKLTRYLEERPLFGRDGLYPKLGSLTTGSGFAFGAGYRTRAPFKRYGTLDVWTAGSATKYFAAEARATFPALAAGRVYAEGYASRRSYPMERFFGIGPESQHDNETNYLFLNDLVGGRAGVRPVAPLLVGGGLDFNKPYVGEGQSDSVPTISTRFDDTSAPGLVRQPDYLRPFAFVEFDYRQPKYARKGGLYRVDFSHYTDREYDAYSFNRVDIDLEQAISILGERRVLTGRAEVVTTDVSSGQQIPFYLMPTLGGNDSLRGFREYRFRGPHALLLQGEYRFEIWSALDGALFYDTGKVADRRSDLDFNHLEHDYGFGFRFNTDNAVIMRVDAGFGSQDGKHVYVVFGGRF